LIVSLIPMLRAAETGKYAVIAPDFHSLAMARLLIDTAEAVGAPILLSHAPSLKPSADLRQYRSFIQTVRSEAESSSTAVGLHLDHAEQFEDVVEAIKLGFTSVMIDASQASWEENIFRTKKVVEFAKSYGVAVEAEIGHVGVSEGEASETGQAGGTGYLTNPQQAAEFARLTGVDALAISIGTVHGSYKGKPHLDFERLAAIRDCVEVPLVLHGGSGTGEANLRQAIQLGIRKINVWSDLMTAIQHESAPATAGGYRSPNDLFAEQRCALQRELGWYFQVSGSAGQSIQRSNDVAARVKQRFQNGYSCSESIFMAFAEEEGYASDAVQLALSLFGGGLCGQGKTCGIVTGALAVLASRYSHVNPTAKETRTFAKLKGREFMFWFEQRAGSTDCKTLTCIDYTGTDGSPLAKDKLATEQVCLPLIEAAAHRLVEIKEETN
jgi:ketose-bisphosphate aldolase/C_GCAxxG_C_C family probable redox protein